MKIENLGFNRSLDWGINKEVKPNGDFSETLQQAINDFQTLEQTNQQNSNLLATGRVDNLHNVMVDLEKADIALQFTLQVRNRIMEAYQEIMRMQL